MRSSAVDRAESSAGFEGEASGDEVFEECKLSGASGVVGVNPIEAESVGAGLPVAGFLFGFAEEVPALMADDPDKGLFLGGDDGVVPEVIVAALAPAVGRRADGFGQSEGQRQFVVDGGDDEEVIVPAVTAKDLVGSAVAFEVEAQPGGVVGL